MQKRFDANKARLTVPEKRSFVQVPAKDPAQAAAIVARLNKGEDSAAVARSLGAKPIVYADTPQSAVVDPAVGQAAFGLKEGQVSGPIPGQLGLAVVKLGKITPGKPATIEDARPEIEKTIQAEQAQDKVYDQVQKYDDARSSGANLPTAAKAAGVQVYQLPPITSDGKMLNGQPLVGLNQQMLTDAFAQSQGGETDVVDLGKGEYYALRVDKVNPTAVPSLEEIRGPLTQVWMTQELVKRMQVRADALAQRIMKGESVEAVAASTGAKVQHLTLNRQTAAQQEQQLGQELLGKAFQAKVGDVFTARGPFGVAIGKLDSQQPAPAAEVAAAAEAQRPQFTMQMVQGDVSDMLRTAARTIVKPKVDEVRAKQVIGVQPQQAPALSGEAAAASKAK